MGRPAVPVPRPGPLRCRRSLDGSEPRLCQEAVPGGGRVHTVGAPLLCRGPGGGGAEDVGGDTSDLLRARWADDVLSLEPTVISVLVGINDTWRRYDEGATTSAQRYQENYRAVLDAAVARGVRRFVLIEPFLAPVSRDQELWWDDLAPRIAVVQRLAAEYEAVLVPAADVFRTAAARTTAQQWCADGVHPTTAGHGLLAQAWLAAIEGCLLYTSDAADEEDSVDLGGR